MADDDPWTRLVAEQAGDGRRRLVPRPARLVQSADDPVVLVLIPDLARLSLTARRALVMLLDAPVAYLERHGEDRQWQPRVKCLAACATADIGKVSRHVLDRFPIRFTADASGAESAHVDGRPPEHGGQAVVLADPVAIPADPAATAAELPQPWPTIAPDVIAAAEAQFPAGASTRRLIALLRLARGLTRIDATPVVGGGQVTEAAKLMGLADPAPREAAAPEAAAPSPPQPPPRPDEGSTRWQELIDEFDKTKPPAPAPGGGTTDQVIAGAAEVMPGSGIAASEMLRGVPYPEDTIRTISELTALSAPEQRSSAGRPGHGPVLGTRRATDLRDIAWIPTLIEAAKYHAIRRHYLGLPADHRLILSPADLQSYRRAQDSQFLLVFVLDYTCLDRLDTASALSSYLNWASQRRAAVSVVGVGADGTRSMLRAQSLQARNAYDAIASGALSRARGRATPLAHGLELAHATLLRKVHRDGGRMTEAWLVVVTDGLANVPLAASLAESAQFPVAGQGVTDALRAASRIAGLRAVRSVVITPERVPHRELPMRLASAMGAGIIRAKAPMGAGGSGTDVSDGT